MCIQRLLYRSDADLEGGTEAVNSQVLAIMSQAQARNAEAGLTGALLFNAGIFIQAIEGPAEAVEAAFERICCDLRHRRVRLVELAVAEERMFGEWPMAHVSSQLQLARLCPTSAALRNARMDAAAAGAIVAAMRTMLLTDAVAVTSAEAA